MGHPRFLFKKAELKRTTDPRTRYIYDSERNVTQNIRGGSARSFSAPSCQNCLYDISRQKQADILLLCVGDSWKKAERLHRKRGAWLKTLGDEGTCGTHEYLYPWSTKWSTNRG